MMNRILTSVVFVVLLFPALALGEEVTLDDLVKTDGLFYKKFTDVPFTGKITGSEQGKIKNGKKEGPWVVYHDNGQLSRKGDFKNGEEEGPWVTYWTNGRVWVKGDYKNGEREGPWVFYYDNGQLHMKGDFKNGEKDGPWVYYHEDGTVNEELDGIYENNKRVD